MSTDVRQDAQAVLELDHRKIAEQELNEKYWIKGDATKVETREKLEEIVKEPDVSLKKRKIGGPDINPGGASSLTANTPKSREPEHKSNAESSNLLAGCIAAVNEIPFDTPSVDLSQDRTARTGTFPGDALKAGREIELRNTLNFDAFELVEELPAGKHAYDMV